MTNVNLAKATKICDAAVAKARGMGITISVSVVDSGTNLVAVQRMDGATVITVNASQGKAVASVLFGQPSGELAPRAESWPPGRTARS